MLTPKTNIKWVDNQRFKGPQVYLDQFNHIVVTFPYNKEYIQKLKKIPGHRWHPVNNEEVIADLTELSKLMRLKNYSHKTIKAYMSCLRFFIHTLIQSFATYLLEVGVDLRYIQYRSY